MLQFNALFETLGEVPDERYRTITQLTDNSSRVETESNLATRDASELGGDFEYDLPHGKGTQKLVSGDLYVGDFRNGIRSGKGKYTFSNGDVYIGEFKKNMFDGNGSLTLKNGKYKTGTFKNNKFVK